MRRFGKCWQELGIISAVAVVGACGDREASDFPALNPFSANSPFPNAFTAISRFELNQTPPLMAILYDGQSGQLLGSRKGSAEFADILRVDGSSLNSGNTDSLAILPGLNWQKNKFVRGSSGELTFTAALHFRDVPIFGSHLREHRDAQGQTWISGRVPDFLIGESDQPEVGEFRSNPSALISKSATQLRYAPERWSAGERQYVAFGSKLRPSWLFTVQGGVDAPGNGPDVPMKIVVDDETGAILKSEAVAFDLDGTANMYMENVVADNSARTNITLPMLLADGSKLESDYWKVRNCQLQTPSTNSCLSMATGSNGDFSAYATNPLGNPFYDEVVAYHGIGRAYSWNLAIMNEAGVGSGDRKDSWGTSRATLGLVPASKLQTFVRAPTSGSGGSSNYNNAQYLPCGTSGNCSNGPWIVIGTGWEAGQNIAGTSETSLRYLGKDADVVMHEFHHHIIFRTLTNTDGETGAMHEGIADYLTYAITGNNRLGEAIVPSTTSSLRAGNLSGKISDYVNSGLHKRGEFWSTTLWDVRQSLGVWKDGVYKADKIIWDAIDLCTESETFYGFIGAMAKAADAFATAHGDNAADLRMKIFTVFYERGFLVKPTSATTLPKATSYISGTSGKSSASKSTSRKSSSSSGWCGVIADSNNASPWANLFLLLSALALPVSALARAGIENRRKQCARVVLIKERRPPPTTG